VARNNYVMCYFRNVYTSTTTKRATSLFYLLLPLFLNMLYNSLNKKVAKPNKMCIYIFAQQLVKWEQNLRRAQIKIHKKPHLRSAAGALNSFSASKLGQWYINRCQSSWQILKDTRINVCRINKVISRTLN